MNQIGPVTEVMRRVRAGFPEGADVLSQKQIPVLLARIEELEQALIPFARIGVRLDSNAPALVDCYTKDCRRAHEMCDEGFSVRPAVVLPDIPATY